MIFGVYALQKKPFSWIPLAVDVLFGLFAFLYHHWKHGNFIKLLH